MGKISDKNLFFEIKSSTNVLLKEAKKRRYVIFKPPRDNLNAVAEVDQNRTADKANRYVLTLLVNNCFLSIIFVFWKDEFETTSFSKFTFNPNFTVMLINYFLA